MIPPSAFRLRDEFDPVVSFAPPFRLFGTDRLSVFLGFTPGDVCNAPLTPNLQGSQHDLHALDPCC